MKGQHYILCVDDEEDNTGGESTGGEGGGVDVRGGSMMVLGGEDVAFNDETVVFPERLDVAFVVAFALNVPKGVRFGEDGGDELVDGDVATILPPETVENPEGSLERSTGSSCPT